MPAAMYQKTFQLYWAINYLLCYSLLEFIFFPSLATGSLLSMYLQYALCWAFSSDANLLSRCHKKLLTANDYRGLWEHSTGTLDPIQRDRQGRTSQRRQCHLFFRDWIKAASFSFQSESSETIMLAIGIFSITLKLLLFLKIPTP